MGTRVFTLSIPIRSPTESYSVNLGGWFVLEPFITPSLFQKYQPAAVDEWTISTAMAADTASGGLSQLENHYKTFMVSHLESTPLLCRF
jgi:hypothetical protein